MLLSWFILLIDIAEKLSWFITVVRSNVDEENLIFPYGASKSFIGWIDFKEFMFSMPSSGIVSIIYSASLKVRLGNKEDNKKESSRFNVFKFNVRSELVLILQKLFFIIFQSTFL